MKKAYFISGLGADKRVFSLLDLSFCEPVYIDWIAPEKKETLVHYAQRLRDLIPEQDPVIIGISFGGMLVTEMAKTDPRIKGIIISTAKVSAQIPGYFSVGKYLPVYNWLPGSLSKKFMIRAPWIFSATKEESRRILREIIIDTDINFARWALSAILNWKNTVVPPNLVHIHGTADRLFPCSLAKPEHTITGGGHLMVLEQHEEISRILKKLIL